MPDLVATSSVYETAPVGGPGGQGAYLNLVVELDTELSARQLLELCAGSRRGRTGAAERWGPRTLDVDIVWIDGVTVDEPDLVGAPPPDARTPLRAGAPCSNWHPTWPVSTGGSTPTTWSNRSTSRRGLAPDRAPAIASRKTTGTERAGSGGTRGNRSHHRTRTGGQRARPRARRRRLGGRVPVPAGRRSATAAIGVDLLVIATPDAVVAEVAAEVTPAPGAVVAHLAGSLGLDVLEPHQHRASLHPLVSIPRPDIGARRLPMAPGSPWRPAAPAPSGSSPRSSTSTGRCVEVADEHRAAYHAAACIASNHLVALLAQVERVAATAGVPLAAYLDLVRGTVDNVEAMGTRAGRSPDRRHGATSHHRPHLGALAPTSGLRYEAMVDRGPPGGGPRARRAAGRERCVRSPPSPSCGECSMPNGRDGPHLSGSCPRWATSTPATCR
jgi:2-amino-4-hydroxy-6-hydroxymethyldihydropteridine diphosphokinase